MTFQISACTNRRKKKEENAVYLLKASFRFTVDYKSRKLKSKLYVSLAANKAKSITQRIYIGGKKILHLKALRLRKNKKCRVGFLTQFKTKCRPSFPGN